MTTHPGHELDVLVALLEEHGILTGGEKPAFERWYIGHQGIYDQVSRSPTFPLSVGQVRELLERRQLNAEAA
jgi:hypothetical protein